MKNRRADGNYMTSQNDFIDAYLKKIDESKNTAESRIFSGKINKKLKSRLVQTTGPSRNE